MNYLNPKNIFIIFFWLVVLVLTSAMLVSLSLSFTNSLYISAVCLPSFFLLRYTIRELCQERQSNIFYWVLPMLAVLLLQMVFIMAVYTVCESFMFCYDHCREQLRIRAMLFNPVFNIAILITYYVCDRFLSACLAHFFTSEPANISFISERRQVSISKKEIMYVESNDTEVWIYTTNGRKYRNKTSISQWERQLQSDFHRIHRSYLVNAHYIETKEKDSIILSDTTSLPVSKKYRETVSNL